MTKRDRTRLLGAAIFTAAVFFAIPLTVPEEVFQGNNFFFVVFVPFVLAVLILISFLTGWVYLAEHYAYSGQTVSQKKSFQSLAMRGWGGYNSCVTLGASQEGLFIAVWPIFRVAHPPLFVPWGDIKIGTGRWLFWPFIEMTTAKVPGVPLRICEKMGEFLNEASGKALF